MPTPLPVLPTPDGMFDAAENLPARRGKRRRARMRTPQIDFRIDYQWLRHTRAARVLRSGLYRAFVGRDGWPLRFHAPQSATDVPTSTSSHLYVHLPFCRQICPHCPYAKTLYRGDSAVQRYGATLRAEIAAYLTRSGGHPVESLYFGGGTPSATPDLIADVIAQVGPHLAPGAEVGVEVHPADADCPLLTRLRDLGVTRISLGIETFRPDLLKTLARRYSPDEAEEAVRRAKSLGFECVDVNLLFGIPGQAVTETAEDARRCLALGVDQVSAYQLFTFVHTALGRRVRHGDFAVYGDRARLRAQFLFNQTCLDAGFVRSSPWNFTRPGIAPYSTVTQEDYVGFGSGAASKVGGVFWFNTFSPEAYVAAETRSAEGTLQAPPPALVLETTDRFRRAHYVYWRLYRTALDAADYHREFGRDLRRDFGALLTLLRATGTLRRIPGKDTESGRYRVTEFGSVWMHRLQQLFSITYIDDLWDRCGSEAWPQEVVLA